MTHRDLFHVFRDRERDLSAEAWADAVLAEVLADEAEGEREVECINLRLRHSPGLWEERGSLG